jgi:hypothetical protein
LFGNFWADTFHGPVLENLPRLCEVTPEQADKYFKKSPNHPFRPDLDPIVRGSITPAVPGTEPPKRGQGSSATARPPSDPSPSGIVARPPEGDQPPAGPPLDLDARGDQDTNSRVEAELSRNPKATSLQIAKAIGKADQTVRRMKAWNEHRARRKATSPQRQIPTVPLTDKILAVCDSKAGDPAEIAAEREEQERLQLAHSDDPAAIEPSEVLKRRYLEVASAHQKGRFYKMTPAEQDHELLAWDATGDCNSD